MNRKEPTISEIDLIDVDGKKSALYKNKVSNKNPKLKIGIILIVAIIAALFIIRASIVDISRIADRHMEPNLYRDDFIIVNKTSYGIRLPVSYNLLFETGEPVRGDVILHRLRWEEGHTFINRIIGLPGDNIEYNLKKRLLKINGKNISKKYLGKYEKAKNVYVENILESNVHILDTTLSSKWGDDDWLASGKKTIPEKKYFVMTDDRTFCCDSRNWGLIDYEDLIGKASITDIRLFNSVSGSHSPARKAH